MSQPERRIDYRLRYPAHLRPRLITQTTIMRVIDISERGIRLTPGNTPMRPGTPFSGRAIFRPDSGIAVKGTILRVAPDHVAVRLQRGFDFRRIYAEYRHLQDRA
jgi:hypothetical protein